jgi:hypothetical protein
MEPFGKNFVQNLHKNKTKFMEPLSDAGRIVGKKITAAFQEAFKSLMDRITLIKADVLAAFQKEHDDLGRVLKYHLLVESYLNKAVIYYNNNNLCIDKLRLTFANKIDLLESKMDEHATYFKGIRELNKIRNKFAHSLSAEITLDDVRVMRPYAETLEQRRIDDPIQIVEKFSLVACALISNQLHEEFGDLSKIYAVIINEVSKNPSEYQKLFSQDQGIDT